MPTLHEDRYLRRLEASKYLENRWGIHRSPKTLAKLACLGGGPVFYRFNRAVLYLPSDLDAWVQEKLSKPLASTSEASTA